MPACAITMVYAPAPFHRSATTATVHRCQGARRFDVGEVDTNVTAPPATTNDERRTTNHPSYGSANTYMRGFRSVLISGVIPAAALPTSDVPVLTATYCLPLTAYAIG